MMLLTKIDTCVLFVQKKNKRAFILSQKEELNSELGLRLHLHEPRAKRVELDIHNVRAGRFLSALNRCSRGLCACKTCTLNELQQPKTVPWIKQFCRDHCQLAFEIRTKNFASNFAVEGVFVSLFVLKRLMVVQHFSGTGDAH